MFDAHSNLAWTTIATAPSPALSGTSLTVASGTATVFPAVPFNCTIYPPSSTPSQSNSEIVRVTNIAGDVLTIVRAQEGTSAKPITVGYRIANTATVKTFTDIETAITALPTFAIQSLSAGTAVATGPQVIFSNSNGVSWGMDGNTLTAQFSGGGGGAAISAGANSQSTGTVVFSNSNGVTFGLSNNGVMTVSVINTGNMAVSAGTQSNDVGTMVFSNSNNVTFGMSNSSVITASVSFAQSTQPVAASASNGSFLFSTLGFSDANGVTFGTSAGSIITASVGAGASPGSISAGTESVALGQVVFSNSNGVSFGLDGSTVTASVNAAGGSINFSAGTQSADLNSIVFSNSNGVSFGLSNGTVTASASGGGGAGFTYDGFNPTAVGIALVAAAAARSLRFFPIPLPNVQFDRAALYGVFTNNAASSNTATVSVYMGIYSKNISSLSLVASASTNQVITYSGTVNNSLNSGPRMLTIPWSTTFSQSNYWMGLVTQSSAGGGASYSYLNQSVANSNFSGVLGVATNATDQFTPGMGWYTVTATSFPASIAFSEIQGTDLIVLRPPMIQFLNGTV